MQPLGCYVTSNKTLIKMRDRCKQGRSTCQHATWRSTVWWSKTTMVKSSLVQSFVDVHLAFNFANLCKNRSDLVDWSNGKCKMDDSSEWHREIHLARQGSRCKWTLPTVQISNLPNPEAQNHDTNLAPTKPPKAYVINMAPTQAAPTPHMVPTWSKSIGRDNPTC